MNLYVFDDAASNINKVRSQSFVIYACKLYQIELSERAERVPSIAIGYLGKISIGPNSYMLYKTVELSFFV